MWWIDSTTWNSAPRASFSPGYERVLRYDFTSSFANIGRLPFPSFLVVALCICFFSSHPSLPSSSSMFCLLFLQPLYWAQFLIVFASTVGLWKFHQGGEQVNLVGGICRMPQQRMTARNSRCRCCRRWLVSVFDCWQDPKGGSLPGRLKLRSWPGICSTSPLVLHYWAGFRSLCDVKWAVYDLGICCVLFMEGSKAFLRRS